MPIISTIKQKHYDEKELGTLFVAALDALSSPIAILDASDTIVAVNSAWCRFAEANGLNLASWGVGSNYLQLFLSTVEDNQDLAETVAVGISDVTARCRDQFYLEYPCGNLDEWRWYALRVTPLDSSRPGHVLVAHENITDRKSAEKNLQTMEERLQYLFCISPIIAHSNKVSGDYGVTFVSDSVCGQLGYDPRNFYENPHFWFQHIHPKDKTLVLAKARRMLKRGHGRLEYRFMDVQNNYRWIYHELNITRHSDGRSKEIVGIGIDISVWKQREDKLRMSRRQTRELALNLESVREKERARIARELHDVIGQEFTAFKFDLTRLRRNLQQQSQVWAAEVTAMIERVDLAIGIVQKISTDLRPAVLDELGLCAAIEWQARRFQERTGIVCRVSFSQGWMEPNKKRAIALFRILQETLTNVARHAEATKVLVRLAREDQSLNLIVEDNGKGISELEITEGKGLGLLGMRERAYLLQGEIAVSSRPEGGTSVAVRIPM